MVRARGISAATGSSLLVGFVLGLTLVAGAAVAAPLPPPPARGSIWQSLGVGVKLGGAGCMPLGPGLRTLPGGVQRVGFNSGYGPLGGIITRWRFGPEVALQLEVVGISRRFRRTYYYPIRQRTETLEVKQLCLDLPLLIQYHRNIFYVEAGVVQSVVLRSGFDLRINSPDNLQNSSGTLADTRRSGSAAAIGVGVEIPEGIWLGVRYQHGLSQLSPKAAATEPVGAEDAVGTPRLNGEQLSPVTFQISAGYVLHPFGQPTKKPLAYRKKKSGKKRR